MTLTYEFTHSPIKNTKYTFVDHYQSFTTGLNGQIMQIAMNADQCVLSANVSASVWFHGLTVCPIASLNCLASAASPADCHLQRNPLSCLLSAALCGSKYTQQQRAERMAKKNNAILNIWTRSTARHGEWRVLTAGSADYGSPIANELFIYFKPKHVLLPSAPQL